MRDDSMFSVGETPWHGLGSILATAPANGAEAIAAAGLDWSVYLAPLQAAHNGRTLDVPMSRAVVRGDTANVLATVGRDYAAIQNRDAFAAFDPWVAEGILSYETAGSLRNGAIVWILAKLAIDAAEIGAGDAVATYALLSNSHDGTRAVRIKGTNVRVVCANTLHASDIDRQITMSVRHTGNVASKVENAVASIDGIRRAAAAQAATYRTLTAIGPRDADTVLDYIAAVYRKDAETLRTGRTAPAIADLFDGAGVGSDLASARGTYWGLYNAVTEYLTHHSGGHTNERKASRADASVFGSGARTNDRALSVAYVMGHDLATADECSKMETDALATMLASHVAARAA